MGVTDLSACPICRSGHPAISWRIPDRYYDFPGAFEVARCGNCSSIWLTDPPDDLSPWYPPSYYAHSAEGDGRLVRARRAALGVRAALSRKSGLLRSIAPSLFDVDSYLVGGRRAGTVLDIGCGAGKALDIYRSAGWTTVGAEISESAVLLAREHGHDVVCCDAAVTALPAGPFEVVRVAHVIEHTSDPINLVQRAAAELADGGVLYVEIPNIAGAAARFVGSAYWQLDPPRHLAIPHPDRLRRSLSELELRNLKSWTYSFGSQLALAARGAVAWRGGEVRWRLSQPATSGLRVGGVALAPVAELVDVIRRGENFCVLAKR